MNIFNRKSCNSCSYYGRSPKAHCQKKYKIIKICYLASCQIKIHYFDISTPSFWKPKKKKTERLPFFLSMLLFFVLDNDDDGIYGGKMML